MMTQRLHRHTPRKSYTGGYESLVGGRCTCNALFHHLCRDVCLLEQELAEKESADEKLKHDLEVEKEKV